MAESGAILGQWREQVRRAYETGRPLRFRGGGTKDFYACRLVGDVLDTTSYAGIISYEPSELVVTARCGTPLREIEARLAAKGQMLAFEPPHFGAGATVGGCVAAGLSGPRRAAAGPLRDFVLGVTVMNGKADVFRFGGQVMKNVAGYDVSRLMAGSMGVLALILDVSLKVAPTPRRDDTLRFACSAQDALDRVHEWARRPMPLSASAWLDGMLYLRLSGAEAAVRSARARIGGEALEAGDAGAFWTGIREHTHSGFASPSGLDGATLWRLAVPSKVPAATFAGNCLTECFGGQRWCWSKSELRDAATAVGGHAMAFRQRHDRPLLQHPSAAVMAIHRRLKAAFDPAGIFNRGRMFAEL